MREFYVHVQSVETSKKVYHFFVAIIRKPPNDRNCIQYTFLSKSLKGSQNSRGVG